MSEISCSPPCQNMVPHPWQVGNVVFMCLQNYWALALCPPESTQPCPLSLQCSNATDRANSRGEMAVSGLPPTRAGRVPEKQWWSYSFSQGVGDASGIEMEGWTWWWFFLLHFPPPPKKRPLLSYSPWIFSEESQHHCGGPETILLLHPSGSLQISKIRWAQE